MIGKGKGYAKLSNGFWRDPKILGLLQKSPSALGIYLACISYCSDNLTDGRIPVAIITGIFHATDSDLAALREHHLMSKQGDDFIITAYLNWQLSKEQIEKHKENRKDRNARYYAKTKQEDSLKTGLKTGLKTTKHKNIKHKNINKREYREKNTNQENDNPRSQAPSPSMEVGNDDWETRLLGWHHGDEHRRMVNRFAQEGKPKVDLDALEDEFKASVTSKGNAQGYVDFDAAFQVWILKRTESLWRKSLPDVPTISPSSHGATIVTGPSEGDWNAYWERYLDDHPSSGTDDYLRERRRFFSVSSSGTLGGDDVRT